jgi:hypothetical protein
MEQSEIPDAVHGSASVSDTPEKIPLTGAEQVFSGLDIQEHEVRRDLAKWLLVMLAVVVLGSGIPVILALGWPEPATSWWLIEKEWLQIVFAPLVTLVATVLGYYFGSRSR